MKSYHGVRRIQFLCFRCLQVLHTPCSSAVDLIHGRSLSAGLHREFRANKAREEQYPGARCRMRRHKTCEVKLLGGCVAHKEEAAQEEGHSYYCTNHSSSNDACADATTAALGSGSVGRGAVQVWVGTSDNGVHACHCCVLHGETCISHPLSLQQYKETFALEIHFRPRCSQLLKKRHPTLARSTIYQRSQN